MYKPCFNNNICIYMFRCCIEFAHTNKPAPIRSPKFFVQFCVVKIAKMIVEKQNVVVFTQKSVGLFIHILRINIYTAGKWIKLVVLAILMSFLFISINGIGVDRKFIER